MDHLISSLKESAIKASEEATGSLAFPPMPEENPLTMPEQRLDQFQAKTRRLWIHPYPFLPVFLPRLFVFGGGALITLYGIYEMYGVVNVGAITPMKWLLLVLFVANFSWISIAFTSGILGFLSLILNKIPTSPSSHSSLQKSTAILIPIYNEQPSRVFAAVQAMIEDVIKTGEGEHFAWFFLSDTTQADILIAEERSFLALRKQIEEYSKIYYRHRLKNTSRKAGNISDFVTRWGGTYAHMIILDADSLMAGETFVSLARAMEADPDAGIIQTLPLIINRNTFFARLQQFAARLYGPVIAAGLAAWSQRDGNYWGHNAIIRTQAFAAHCGLPVLSGRPPFGGHILSHDFVEAALIRRAGYSVYMLPTLEGSYEESPPSLIDLASRDRRWCQGNLQHIRLLWAQGFSLATRQHFATGIMAYLASPFWMGQLLVGLILVFQSAYIRPEYFTNDFRLFPTWPRFDAERALHLFLITMAVLLAPKILGLIRALMLKSFCQACGGQIRLILSALLEMIVSALMAPIMMVMQTGAVMQILFGRDTGWNPQRRDDGSIPFHIIARRHYPHVALGILTLISGLIIAPSLVAWMSPTIGGLILSIFISWASGKKSLGLFLKKYGVLLIPEEKYEPSLVTRANFLAQEKAFTQYDNQDALQVLAKCTSFRDQHRMFIPSLPLRRRGEIDPDKAVAEAKLNEARTLEEAMEWLQPKERLTVVQDRILMNKLICLVKSEDQKEKDSLGSLDS